MFLPLRKGGLLRRHVSFVLGALALIAGSGSALAQDDDDQIEEITVTGSQIKGANITDALAVTVFDTEEIAALGIESGAELLDLIPENGQNFFSETDVGGGVNGARGDISAFNLRNMGTGNTLVLLNGRRLVNAASYQTEAVGGSFVPVNSVNSNHIPVYGVERVEVLRDGASAIYGADAVAGVVNTVLKDDFEGLTVRARFSDYDPLPRNDQALSVEWGKSLNGGDTHIGMFARYVTRDPINAQDDPRWADSDFRHRFDPSSPFATATTFRNNSANSLYGQFDVVSGLGSSHSLRQNDVTDSSGEFEVYPSGDPRCAGGFDTGYGTCIHEDGQGTIRYNTNELRDLLSDMDRATVYAYLNHQMSDETEFFADAYFYRSSTHRVLHSSTPLGAVRLRVGAENYYNPLGPCSSPNRLPDSIIGTDVPCTGLELRIDNYRFAEFPRVSNTKGDSFRVLAGFRGVEADWDWETAFLYSEATRNNVTNNRVSNSLITAALYDPTPSAYNPFSGGVNSNIDQALVDVYRNGETTLGSIDLKISNPDLFELPAGSVGALFGMEVRRETFEDLRDPRLNGTIDFTDFEGESYPLTSDVVNSSPTPDSSGSRVTTSAFGELQIPLLESLDVQLAVRYEDFSDVGDTTVGKLAFGWRPWEPLLVRGSLSTAFRAPNLITVNEGFVARSNTRDDWVCFYGVDQGTLPDDTFGDCDYSMQRQATGSKNLKSEKSDNYSIGFALDPIENMTFTFDFWSIEKNDTIGLFGEENHVLVDLITRLEAGTSNCAAVVGNPFVTRDAPTTDPTEVQGFLDAGLCPVGEVLFVADQYANLDTRTIEGYDIGWYWNIETAVGDFAMRYNGSFYQKYVQSAGGVSAEVIAAKEADPTIVYPLVGLGDLIDFEGNQSEKHSASVIWNSGDWGASVSALRLDGFVDVLSTGAGFEIPSMTTYNMKIDYDFEMAGTDTRVRLGINNFTDERAPIADANFGFFQDAHRDWGRNWYVDLRMRF
jgi:outer membrane receptor protein involved in Fe transport